MPTWAVGVDPELTEPQARAPPGDWDGIVLETRPDALTATLDDKAQISLLRTKNSWGNDRPDRAPDALVPGYYDLYMDYLNGPVDRCEEDADGNPTDDCSETVPLNYGYLPKGYWSPPNPPPLNPSMSILRNGCSWLADGRA